MRHGPRLSASLLHGGASALLRSLLLLSLGLSLGACGPQATTTGDVPDDGPPSFSFGDGDGDEDDGDGDDGDDDDDVVGDGDGDGDGDLPDDTTTGAALYALHCANCHGANGVGGSSPTLAGTTLPFEALSLLIDETMPLGTPEACTGTCAERIASYLLTLPAPDASCASSTLPTPSIRLLARGELHATLADLVAPLSPSCTALSSCDVARESCVDGVCAPDACATKTFVFTPSGSMPTTVHVAGSMNGWAPTIAAGGWPLTYDATLGAFVAKHAVVDGDHQYKLVLDETTWITDPQATLTAPDGFGGQNARLVVACADVAPPVTIDFDDEGLVADYPPSVRSAHFPFDGHADTGVVSTAHVDALMAISDEIARHTVARLPRLLPCAATSADTACADSFVDVFAARAWRRPLALDERARVRNVITSAPDFTEGVHRAVQMVLLSPGFAYRTELGVDDGNGALTLTEHEIASALSYFLTGSMPDAILLALADEGALHDPVVRAEEAARLLATPRADRMLARFVESWLGIENLGSVSRVDDTGAFTPAVRARMLDETRALFVHVAKNGTLDDLFTSSFTFGDSLLASFYGLSSTDGVIALPFDRQGGLLGHGSVLSVLAYPTETSPVRRGLFVRERLLCQDLGIPPPNAGGVPDVDPNATTRERFEQHTTNPQCAACHQYIDDVGFGLERYDHTGRLRATDNGFAIDASGDMNDVEGLGTGTSAPYEGPRALGLVLAESDAARTCFVSQVARFQSGTEHIDACALSALDDDFVA